MCTATTYKDREGNEKTKWTRIGTTFIDGDKISHKLDALPISGQCASFQKKPQEGKTGGYKAPQTETKDQDMPF